jgi:hypothetical protein
MLRMVRGRKAITNETKTRRNLYPFIVEREGRQPNKMNADYCR